MRGLRDNIKRRHLFYYLHEKDFDIICLQETHSSKPTENLWRSEWDGHIWYSHGETNARGVAILTKRESCLQVNDIIRDKDGRSIIARGQVSNERILLVNLYGPNQCQPDFFVQLFSKIESIAYDRVLIMGDINTVLDYEIDRSKKVRHPNYKATEMISTALDELDMIDIW